MPDDGANTLAFVSLQGHAHSRLTAAHTNLEAHPRSQPSGPPSDCNGTGQFPAPPNPFAAAEEEYTVAPTGCAEDARCAPQVPKAPN
mmetsp:Transcript_12934/g.18746  ORF Transcript_12934/g.18746 Transcript_12934/m.18746 type:complete len:87 (-) Transcript_12934:83-343(-)